MTKYLSHVKATLRGRKHRRYFYIHLNDFIFMYVIYIFLLFVYNLYFTSMQHCIYYLLDSEDELTLPLNPTSLL